jgi:hypothetical protein
MRNNLFFKLTINKKKRKKSFNERAKISEIIRFKNIEYINIHPFSDDMDLDKINLKPSDCRSVDCYVKSNEEIYFVQVYSCIVSSRKPGAYYRISDTFPYFININVTITEQAVSRKTMEKYIETSLDRVNSKEIDILKLSNLLQNFGLALPLSSDG